MKRIEQLISTYPELEACASSIEAAYETLRDSYRHGGKLLVCGNGGSASDAEHVVGELMKGYLRKRPVPQQTRERLESAGPQDAAYLAAQLQGALPAISLVSQSSLVSAVANDTAADMVFAQQVYGYGREGDVLLALSTSGSSRNLVRAAQAARALGLRTIALTGPTGGALKPLCDVCICAPGESTPAIQERHLPIYHTLCAMLEEEFFT